MSRWVLAEYMQFQPWLSFVLLFQPDVCLLFVWTSLYYAEWYAVLSVVHCSLTERANLKDDILDLSARLLPSQ